MEDDKVLFLMRIFVGSTAVIGIGLLLIYIFFQKEEFILMILLNVIGITFGASIMMLIYIFTKLVAKYQKLDEEKLEGKE